MCKTKKCVRQNLIGNAERSDEDSDNFVDNFLYFETAKECTVNKHDFETDNCNIENTNDICYFESNLFNHSDAKNNDQNVINKSNHKIDAVEPVKIVLNVDNTYDISFEVDSGFAYSAISENLYNQYFRVKMLHKNDLVLKDYVGHVFQPLGKVFLPVLYKTKRCVLETYTW